MVMVALGAFITCIAIGAMSRSRCSCGRSPSRPLVDDAVSSAMTLNFLAMAAAGFGWAR